MRRILIAAMLAGTLGSCRVAVAADAEARAAALTMLADITLIDGECRDFTTNFGPAFQASAAYGLSPADIMPTGRLRPDFERTLRKRRQELSEAELCGPVASRYASDLPGAFSQK